MTFNYLGSTGFGGYDKRIGAADGAISEMLNLSAKDAPVLRTRPLRLVYGENYHDPQAVYGGDKLYVIAGGKFYADGEEIGSIGDDRIQSIIPIGNKLVIFPAWYQYDIDSGELCDMKRPLPLYNQYGEYRRYHAANGYSEDLYPGYLLVVDDDLKKVFIKGQKVKFSYSVNLVTNYYDIEDTIIDTAYVNDRFYVKMMNRNFPFRTQTGSVDYTFFNISVIFPEMENVFACDNRLWGYIGSDIHCTALGMSASWEDFSGLLTDSWVSTINRSDKINGCGVVAGTPTFFCENAIYKVYGSNPTEYGYTRSDALGLKEGEQRSVATGGQYVYYVSRRGICAYNGGIPSVISQPLASEHFQNAVGGSDGVRYYLTCEEEDGTKSLLVFDPGLGYWMREDSTQAIGFSGYHGNAIVLTDDGTILGIGDCWDDPDVFREGSYDPEYGVNFSFRTSQYIDGWYAKKGANRMLVSYEADRNTKGRIYVNFDGEGDSVVAELYPGKRRTVEIPLPMKRYDTMTVTVVGRGDIKLWMMARNVYASSERR